ncbi:AraC family transcriptional regulator [Liquorilactobacillus mali]|uniref:AraC-type DNA-binding domain-containing protein n=1 Tax=Liquorilactobacillus mali KCTC 3596 = DSM 20444 TaxID=1046596 RepID=A0A0R2E3R4_9LACO|nr:AraC family transcriptional regulator [Liquorilactobacillus mali]KRN11072.1 AraC-type DNA-binding domain-containing protein [Liquorilactobacillus mali KCTC 3596 = DSM 20444]MDV7757521.1 helix-turn-helix domain-containing protein [Liquorilactobacillus mali]QFQ75565.1 helix-turn-helix transcriptional regulator [Liquorilactobacillus mali]
MKQVFWQNEKEIEFNNDKGCLAYIYKITTEEHYFFRGAHAHATVSEITFILDGQNTYFLEDTFFNVSANDVLFYNKEVIHEEGNCLPSICIGLYGDIFSTLGKSFLLHLNEEDFAILAELAQNAYHLVKSNQVEMAESLILNLIIQQLNSLIYQNYSRLKLIIPSESTQKINLIKQYIDHHFQENIDITFLSTENNSSRSYIQHQFKNIFLRTPIDYLISRRVGEAQTILISKPDYPVTHIAFDMGFHSLSHFDHVFTKVSGISPTEYRNRYMN